MKVTEDAPLEMTSTLLLTFEFQDRILTKRSRRREPKKGKDKKAVDCVIDIESTTHAHAPSLLASYPSHRVVY